MNRVPMARSITVGVLALCLLGACGVPQDATDRPLRGRVAFEPPPEPTTSTATTESSTSTTSTTTTIPGPTTTAVPTTTAPPPPVFPFMLFWVRDDQIVRVRRTLAVEATLDLVVDAFRLGPDELETENNLRTALPTPSAILNIVSEAGTATVELDPSFLTLPGSEQVRGICQIVFTVTGVGGIGLVRFSINGRRVAVPRADGQPTTKPVSRDDYASLVLDGGQALVVPTTTLTTSIPRIDPDIYIHP